MLAPIDKLNQPRGNRIVQVVVTTKCDVHTCSNCTQLLPFRTDYKEMTLECVEAALRSLEGWPGIVAMFGGNPTMHGRFPELCDLWARYVPERQRGLWTNNLRGYGPIVRTIFPPGKATFNLNTHGDPRAELEMRDWLPGVPVYGTSGRNHHAAMLVDYRDLGLSEAEWVPLRERCDVNRKWSSGVYQRDTDCPECFGGGSGDPYEEPPCETCSGTGIVQRPFAYFCEVAGSLDGIRGENHGIPAVSGWWKQGMDGFGDQVRQCCDRGCGVPLRATGHQDQDAVYDVSAAWAHLVPKGRVTLNVLAARPPEVHENTDYIGFRLKEKR